MGCLGRCLALFLLLFCAPISPSSFSECMQRPPLERFWQDSAYLSSNPYISQYFFTQFYSFAFDNASQSLALENITLADAEYFGLAAPPEISRELSQEAAYLDSASASLQSAAAAQAEAHASSIAAQKAMRDIFSQETLVLMQMYGVNPLVLLPLGWKIIETKDISFYMALYPRQIWAAYSSAADTYDSANAAVFSLAKKADEKLQWLSHAGAGQSAYSGSAQQKYFEAKSQLSASSPLCSQSYGAQAISAYFSSKPALPDLFEYRFMDYLEKTAGRKNTSAVFRLANIFAKLSQAQQEMESDYTGSLLSAHLAVQSLEGGVELLADERLELIGEPPSSSQQGFAAVGSSFSGVYSGFRSAKDRLAESEQLLSSAKQYRSATTAEDFLASAILQAKAANQKAASALSSLHSVRANAESAVSSQSQLAEAAIARAESIASSAKPASFTDAQAQSEAAQLLEKAKGAQSSAAHLSSLGEKFVAHTEAVRLASAAAAASDRALFLPAASAAQQELLALGNLLSDAKRDDLGVDYEEWRLSEYRKLLSSSQSLDSAEAVYNAAKADRQSVLLRLSGLYSGLAEKHLQARALVMEIRGENPLFLPEFDSLSKYFEGSTLMVQSAAGRLKQIESQLDSQYQEAQKRLPQHLSWALSKNAQAFELYSPPALGQTGNYYALITTSNPTEFSYSGGLQFSIPTTVPLYSADFASGDQITDAYPEKGKTTIILPGVASGQPLAFGFEKADSPAQITSSIDECSQSYSDSAPVKRSIAFFAARNLSSLALAEPAPISAYGARVAFSGKEYQLAVTQPGEGQSELLGAVPSVKQGKNSLSISYAVASPFTLSTGERSYLEQGLGSKKVSYTVSISNVQIDCASALVALEEPFSNLSALSVSPLGAEKVAQPKIQQAAGKSQLAFSFLPLRRGENASFAVSYTITDASAALAEGLASAELQVAQYGRQSDILLLAQAKLLASQNRTAEALAILGKMRQDALALALSSAEQGQFSQENSSASALLSQASEAQSRLAVMNASESAAKLSTIAFKLNSSIYGCHQLAESGDYSKAVSQCRRAQSDFRAQLSSLAWQSASEASEAYAAARKGGADAGTLAAAADEIATANRLYVSGEHLPSYIASTSAKQLLAKLFESQLLGAEQASSELEKAAAEFSALSAATDSLLAKYSAQYAALSGQSKKQLPITPAAAQQKIDEAAKGMAAAAKQKIPSQGLHQANASYQKLAAVAQSLENALSQLNSSAASSLLVAKAALSEARQKSSSEDQQELSQIESEVSRAENYLSESLFADSIMASDRALSAAAAFISKKSSSGLNVSTIALAAASIAFIAAAAHYFSRKKKPEEKKTRKIGKAD